MGPILQNHGPISNAGEHWTNTELDLLLDKYLHEGLCVYAKPGRPSLFLLFGRTEDAIQTSVWKAAARYESRPCFRNYTPENRTNRTGHAWTERDHELFTKTLDSKYLTTDEERIEWASKILSRDTKEIKRQFRLRRPEGLRTSK